MTRPNNDWLIDGAVAARAAVAADQLRVDRFNALLKRVGNDQTSKASKARTSVMHPLCDAINAITSATPAKPTVEQVAELWLFEHMVVESLRAIASDINKDAMKYQKYIDAQLLRSAKPARATRKVAA